ncbi:MAG TPA: type II toxin-antitoxin system VapC family toxin [Gemmataceae bacterium]|jgi:predicted nucleic acid-binding protein|nr:type II toxin-antitoxin system VapC family toxin [Gemmataceae bacterium]
MIYVLDSSVAFKWEVPETDSDKATRLRDDFRQAVHNLLVPDFFPQELAHALTRAERQGRIAVGQAGILWADALVTPPALLPVFSLTPRAIEISSSLRIGVYDCLYIALAEREGCEFLTADDKLVKNLQGQFPFIVPLSASP